MLFADVILPLPLAQTYTYSIPQEWADSISLGCRVMVHFGKKKYYTAVVFRLHDTPPSNVDIKPISHLLDSSPVVSVQQMAFWQWIADYYLCTLGDIYKAALPSGLKPESESVITLSPDYEMGEEPPSEHEITIIEALRKSGETTISRLEKHIPPTRVLPTVQRLLARGAVTMFESIVREYKAKTTTHLRLAEHLRTESALQTQLSSFGRAGKQQHLLLQFLVLLQEQAENSLSLDYSASVDRKTLLERASASSAVLQALLAKGILESFELSTSRLTERNSTTTPLQPLTTAQQDAFQQINDIFQRQSACLLHGVTGSGKTEIYMHLIAQTLEQGKQVLYLLPEIALTAQITERLQKVFGDRLGVYHSKFPDAERVEIWQKQLSSVPYDVILGVRSSVFLPFQRLGLVIIDEEHEATYKQQDPAPRYHARSAGVILARRYGAHVLLGSATPSIESYYAATQGKMGLVTLEQRHGEGQLPEIQPVDIYELRRKKLMRGLFSPYLLEQIKTALAEQEQVILFQNRRGYAPMIECKTCGWVPKCKNCDVSLTYHKGLHQLTCHYCGFTYAYPQICPACEGTEIAHRGYGTEKVEDAIREALPDVRVGRMDLDTTRSRNAYERIISDFQEGRTYILVGTQMVSKGLDFDRVNVVGVVDADVLLSFPDFRAHERGFQLLSQVAGRAGRRQKRGLVILQTRGIDSPIIQQVMTHDYVGMYRTILAEREAFRYPPFVRLIYVYLKHKKEAVVEQAAEVMSQYLRTNLTEERVLGPDRPAVARVQTLHIRKIMLKIEPNLDQKAIKAYLLQVQRYLLSDTRFHTVMVYYDVDPM